jgi:hypothetical protein
MWVRNKSDHVWLALPEGQTMSQRYSRSQAVVKSRALARNAAHDSAIGAALGLLLVSGLVASSLDISRTMAQSSAPVLSLIAIVAVVVGQCALAAALCGVAVRKFSALD